MTGQAKAFTLPPHIRRTLGLRAPRQVPFDGSVKLRTERNTWLLTHPDDIRHVLVGNSGNYMKTRFLTSEEGKLRAGEGLLTSRGKAHRRQRRLLQPMFAHANLEPFAEIIAEKTEKQAMEWEGEDQVDLVTSMAGLSLSILLKCLFNLEEGDEFQKVCKAIEQRRRYTQYLYYSRLPFRTRLPTPAVRQNRKAVQTLSRFISEQIAIRREDPEASPDMLSMLVNSHYGDGSTMSDTQVLHEALTFTSTGYETLGEALAWTGYHLACNPEVEIRLHEEVQSVLQGRRAGFEDFNRLPFTECVFRESMRLHPPTWIFERVPVRPDTLPSGLHVPAGAKLYLCQFIMHRHPGHFPEPETFDPTRFFQAPRRAFRFSYLPFGDGAHACLGENYAMLQGVLVLAGLLQKYSLKLVSGQNIAPFAGITYRARKGIYVRPVYRKSTQTGDKIDT